MTRKKALNGIRVAEQSNTYLIESKFLVIDRPTYPHKTKNIIFSICHLDGN